MRGQYGRGWRAQVRDRGIVGHMGFNRPKNQIIGPSFRWRTQERSDIVRQLGRVRWGEPRTR